MGAHHLGPAHSPHRPAGDLLPGDQLLELACPAQILASGMHMMRRSGILWLVGLAGYSGAVPVFCADIHHR